MRHHGIAAFHGNEQLPSEVRCVLDDAPDEVESVDDQGIVFALVHLDAGVL